MPQNHARSAFLIRPVSLTGIPIRWGSQDDAATCRRVRVLRRRTGEYAGICDHRKAETGNVHLWREQSKADRQRAQGLHHEMHGRRGRSATAEMTITQDRVYQREEAMQRVTNGETQADVARAYNVHPAPPLIYRLTGP